MKGTMKAAVMNQIGKFDFEERPIPEVKDDEVLVKLDYVGICGSDMHLFEDGYIGENHVTKPMILGHEPGGVIVESGKDVTDLKVGDRVAIEPGIPCWKCEYCKSGWYNLCPNVYFYASLPVTEGAFVEYLSHPANLCYRLPDNVSTLEGALMEPLAVGFHAALQSGAQVGSTAVILGAGCIGLVTMLALKSMGVSTIIVVDLMQNRLNRALSLGATSNVFETAGSEVTIFQTAKMVKRGGTITLVGYTKDGIAKMNVNWLIDNEITIKTVFRYRNIYPKAIAAVANGIIPLKKIASDIYDFKDIQAGMEHAIHDKDKVSKCVIRINPDAQ